MISSEAFTAIERRAVLGLASLYCLRMLGLFMVLPLFAVYAEALAGASAASIGLALGAYGLTQAVLQVPLGWLSDQIGRKPVIVGGLTLLILGSVVAALADTLMWLAIGQTPIKKAKKTQPKLGSLSSVFIRIAKFLEYQRLRLLP